jgi:hypothetical protein
MLFKVPKEYFIEHSVIFRDMFSLPREAGASSEGSSDENPLVLEGICSDSFSILVEHMYPK